MIWKGTEDRCAGKRRRHRQRRGRLPPAPGMHASLMTMNSLLLHRRLSNPPPGCITGRTGRYFVPKGGSKPRVFGRCMKKTFCQDDAGRTAGGEQKQKVVHEEDALSKRCRRYCRGEANPKWWVGAGRKTFRQNDVESKARPYLCQSAASFSGRRSRRRRRGAVARTATAAPGSGRGGTRGL